ncbi:nuclear transport factor 2 family protein [Lichenifustis flavocetrariae]|uniref:Nuclear transport factor 2 family protein n=1 Tax=Lichenifustis flavocetrariae TaxID=2949735 RepID=A0AA42CL64_9HYPH|nr:nuclear transport factor 2 family protein [Lichenifustis flavocetrariae]MCW6510051.1 nuclear transport factor 2 family protein [Lichenifustis flavocetrariae]
MNENKAQTAFRTYLDAFGKTSPAEREEVIRSCVAEDVSFSNPGVDGRGRDHLLTHTARFQERFPGDRFKINWLREQHGQVLAEWTQVSRDGTEFITAHSYARLDDEGRIVQFAGFWDPF